MNPIPILILVSLALSGAAWADEPCPRFTDRARGLELRLSRPDGEQACRLLDLIRSADGERLVHREVPPDAFDLGLRLGPSRAGKLLLQGRYGFWVFDLVERSLTGPFGACVPEGADSQSGMLSQLAWLADDLVFGRAVDRGRFVFALAPKARELVPAGSWSADGYSGLDCAPDRTCLILFTDPADKHTLGLLGDRLAFRDRRLRPAKVLAGDELGQCKPRWAMPVPAVEEVFDAADRLRGVALTERGRSARPKLVFDPLAGKLLTLTDKAPVAAQLARQANAVAVRLWQGRRYDKAAEAFGLALDLAPDKPAWRLQLAAVLTQAGRLDEAVRAVAAAARQDLGRTKKTLRTRRAFAKLVERPEVRALLTSTAPVYPAPAAAPGLEGDLAVYPIGWSADGEFAWVERRPAHGGPSGRELALTVLKVDDDRRSVELVHPLAAGAQAEPGFEAAWRSIPASWPAELAGHGIVPAVGVALRPFPARIPTGPANAWFAKEPGGKTSLMVVGGPAEKPRTLATEALPASVSQAQPVYLKNPFDHQRLLIAVLPMIDAAGRTTQRLLLEPF